MARNENLKRHERYYFVTKGLIKKDLLDISCIFTQYEIDIVYKADDYETNDINTVIKVCEENNITSLHAHSYPNKDGYYVSLHIIGEFSSWDVSFPPDGSIKERAVAAQLFGDIKKILDVRRERLPQIPWSTLRDVLVFVPIFLLSIKVIFPTFIYGYSEILRISIYAAIFNYLLAMIQTRRVLRRVIFVKPTLRERLGAAKGWIGATVAAAAISLTIESLLKYLYHLFS